MSRHVARIAAITVLIAGATFLPFVPGDYDGLAVTLSVMAQMVGTVGLLLVPVGALWLVHDLMRRLGTGNRSSRGHYGRVFAMVSMVVMSIVALAVAIGAAVGAGPSLGVATLALSAYTLSKLRPALRRSSDPERLGPNAAPLYLVCIPIIVAVVQFTLIDRATEFSRRHAMAQSELLIRDIEQYRDTHGRYPMSLLSLWEDYKPSVIGINRFHYEPNGDAYNIFFEQFSPRFGTREIVMYNKRDEHVMTSHNMDLLRLGPEELNARRGYYAVHDGSLPHWKYFWFD